MGGSRIKGITVENGGDTTGLDKALKGVNSTIKTTQTLYLISPMPLLLCLCREKENGQEISGSNCVRKNGQMDSEKSSMSMWWITVFIIWLLVQDGTRSRKAYLHPGSNNMPRLRMRNYKREWNDYQAEE